MNKLYSTYENCSYRVGKKEYDEEKTPLLPIAHSTQNAQVEVTLDIHGGFKNAIRVEKENAMTIIPVTEDSASRGNGNYPHPLFDKLQYVAGDYVSFTDGKKSEEFYQKYMEQLEDWCTSGFSHPYVCAIWEYLKKGTLVSDLVNSGILVCGSDGKLDTKVKMDAGSQTDAFVRFKVSVPGVLEERVWLDREVWDSYIGYYVSTHQEVSLCYARGEVIPGSDKHPSKIRNTADKAKLVSGNDSEGFTYRGRFLDKSQAASVGYETSQKAHNALKWLIEKQGYSYYEQAVVAWGTQDQKLPPLQEDWVALMSEGEESAPPNTYETFAKRLTEAISGYRCVLDKTAEIVVMGLDSATTGRLSITYYRELDGSDFLDRLHHWHQSCIWRHTYKSVEDGVDEKGKTRYKRIVFVGAPAPREIARAAFGAKASDKLIKATQERLLPCIVDKARLPYDIVRAAVGRAKNPVSMEHDEWEKVRTITCALVKKYRKDRFGEEWSMDIQQNETNIHYLCGRLLAVADEMESWALKAMGEKRETNAIRFFERFAQNPMKTWGIIVKKLNPYEIKLTKMEKNYKWLLDIREEISQMIDLKEFEAAKNLDGRFILGFDCQKKAIHDEITRKAEARALANAQKKEVKTENEEEK